MVVNSGIPATKYVSKSDYLNYRKCPGYAWMVKHRPADVPVDPDPLYARRSAAGDAVEALARQMYPDGVLIDTLDPVEAVARTHEAIAAGTTTIFQATVLTDEGLMARADILQRVGDMWDLLEVKASTSADAGHKVDATFQVLAFSQAGFLIRNVGILHLDRHYIRNGALDVRAMMRITDITPVLDALLARLIPAIPAAVRQITDPTAAASCNCHVRSKSQRCPAFAVLHPDVPDGDTIYDIAYISGKSIKAAVDRGVLWQRDWPADIPLPKPQRRQIELLRSGEQRFDRTALGSFLDTICPPVYFLDYETADSAIPQFNRYRPWMKIPFQYSLHIVHADGSVEHRAFLWRERGVDPVPALVEQLLRDIGPTGSIIAWNKGFESGCHVTMADVLPHRAAELLALNERLVDLGDVVNKGMWLHPGFDGRWSIKVVLPVAAPDLSYADLEIGNGGIASSEWARCMLDSLDVANNERDAVFGALLRYCELDSLAMVRIWQHVLGLLGAPSSTDV